MNTPAPALPFVDCSSVVSADGITGTIHFAGRNIAGHPQYQFRFVDSLGNRCMRRVTCANHYANYSPAPVVAPVAEPFVAPAPSGPVVSVCNRLVLDEWSRLAKAAYAAGHNAIGHKFSMGATVSEGTRVCPKWFDSMQDVYRAWLVFGWDDAVPAFQKAFPAVSA